MIFEFLPKRNFPMDRLLSISPLKLTAVSLCLLFCSLHSNGVLGQDATRHGNVEAGTSGSPDAAVSRTGGETASDTREEISGDDSSGDAATDEFATEVNSEGNSVVESDDSELTNVTLASTTRSINGFPTLSEYGVLGYPTSGMRSSQDAWQHQVFALVKLAVIIAAVFVWLGCLRVAMDGSVRESIRAGSRSSVRTWAGMLFVAGLVALPASLLLPASAMGGLILLAGIVLPYSMFVSWQHAHVEESDSKLSWFPVVKQHTESRPVFEAVETDDASGEQTAIPIRLVGKSALRESTGGLSQSVEDSPAFQYVLSTISKAVASNATDLHINTRTKTVEIKQRIDGTLSLLAELPISLGASVINIFKIMSELSIADRRRSQDGSFLADVGDRRLSFRVSTQATQTGEKLSIRILDPSSIFADLGSLGMPDDVRERCEHQLTQKHGLILFVGATGAGKSTTACAALQMIDTSIKNIVSIEDPIEYQIPNVDQVEVNLKAGQTFETALRSILRLDADVVFVGEIRDAETAKIAVQAAQTGQLVLATMHATDSVGGFQRLSDLVGDPTAVASTVRAIVSQTLVRKLCPSCRIEYNADNEIAGEVGVNPDASLYRSNTEMVLKCPVCEGRRFMRRTAVYEITEATPEIRELVRNKASIAELTEAAKRNGLVPIREQASLLVRDGTISMNELNRVLGS